MPFSYKFKLNKQKITGIEIGFTTSRKWEEALDEAKLSLPLMETDSPLSMLGLLQIEVSEFTDYENTTPIATKTYDFLVYSDVISEATKYGRYKHELSMIEYTAKMDYYIMPSLAKSRSIISNVQAPFSIDHSLNFGAGDTYDLKVRLPFLEVKSSYYSHEEITFDQVGDAYIVLSTTGPNYRVGDAYISTDASLISGTKPHNLSDGSATWKFPKGKHKLYYGFVSQAGDIVYGGGPSDYGFHAVYTFDIKVIDRQELSMFDVIDEIRSCVSRFGGIEDTVYFDSTRVFNLSSTDEAYLKTIQAPQMYLENATARQMLIFALSYVNGLPRLEWGEQIDTLKVEQYNLSMGVFSMNDIVGRSGQQNTNQIGSRVYSRINQALPNNMDNPSVFMPSQSGKVQVRATVQQITADEFEIKLPEGKPLYTPIDLIVRVEDVVVTNTETSEVFSFGDIDLSLMPRFINRDEWFLKTITNDFPSVTGVTLDIFSQTIGLRPNRISNLSWQMGDTSIKLSNVYGVIFQSNLIRNVVIEALREYIMLRIPVSFDASTVYRTYTLSYTIPSTANYKDWRFRVEYITDENLVTKQDKEDLSQINFYSEMRHNQDEALVNIVRQSRKSYGDLQRSGNVGYTFSKLHTSLSQAYDVGQRDVNGFTINEIHTEWHNNFFMNTYVVTKHHNRISQATFVDQTYRWRDNYAKTVLKRHEHYSDYLIVSPPNEMAIAEFPNKIYSNYTVKIAMGILFGNGYIAHKTKASTAFIRTDGMLDVYEEDSTTRKVISVPVSSFGIKGGFVFTFGFENNQVAGDGLVERGTSKWYNQAVRYTDEEGRFTRFGFWIVRDRGYDASDDYTYPLLSLDEADESLYLGLYDITTQYFGCGFINGDYGAGEPMVVNKDPLTNYQQSYQLNVVSYYQGLYIFGLKFYTDNLLVNNERGERNNYLYVYRNGERYEMFEDLFVKSGYATSVLLDISTMSFDLSTLRLEFLSTALTAIQHIDTTSWAIGNEDGDLYLACNEALNGLKIFKTHIRPNLWEIGLKAFASSFYTLDSAMSIGLSFGFERGKNLAYSLSSSMAMSLNMTYRKSKDIGFDLSTTTAMGLSMSYVKGKSLAYDLSGGMSLGFNFGYGKSLDFGLDISGGMSLGISLSYSIGDAKVIDLSALGMAVSMTFEYYRSKNIGFSLSSTIPLSLDMTFVKSYTAIPDIGGALNLGFIFNYYRSKDIGFTITNAMSMGMSMVYTITSTGYAITGGLSMGLTFSFSKAIATTVAPGITNKSITPVKDWGNSTQSYWNAQEPSNRTTIDDPLGFGMPEPYAYDIGFAVKYRVTGLYSYYKITQVGNTVRWQIVNEEQGAVTIYCRIGTSGSYENYGTVADGGISSLLSKYVIGSGSTTVYAYAQASNKAPSSVVSL